MYVVNYVYLKIINLEILKIGKLKLLVMKQDGIIIFTVTQQSFSVVLTVTQNFLNIFIQNETLLNIVFRINLMKLISSSSHLCLKII